MPSSPSWGARSILQQRQSAKNFICYVVGEGSSIDFWKHPWHPDGILNSSEGRIFNLPKEGSVKEFRIYGTWDKILTQPQFQELKTVINSGLFSQNPYDYAVWKPAPDGAFSIKSAWNQVRKKHPVLEWTSSVWFKGSVPRQSLVTWQALTYKLSTRDRIMFLNPSRETRCPLCKVNPETIDHLFFKCSFSSWIWKSILWRFTHRRNLFRTLAKEEEWIRRNFRGRGQTAIAMRIAFNTAVYMIWLERNTRIFENKEVHKQRILAAALNAIRDRVIFLNLEDIRSSKIEEVSKNWNFPYFYRKNDSKFCSWVMPMGEMVKLNTDGALNSEGAGIGRILRDGKRNIIAMFSVDKPVEEIHGLEMEAVLHGLELAHRKNIQHIWVKSDSMMTVKIIEKMWTCSWKKIPTFEKIMNLLNKFKSWKISHIWREANQAADYLSKPNCSLKGEDIQSVSIPSDLHNIVSLDYDGMVYSRV
ncbi:uncharacterized protein LOC143861430 [Tasmannia lanceolata]|uniref:uncharacterized protein LOC143861430 n=1 Tax=Tasmannia lanceolata TaxID=3420 RepID=UPI004063850A